MTIENAIGEPQEATAPATPPGQDGKTAAGTAPGAAASSQLRSIHLYIVEIENLGLRVYQSVHPMAEILKVVRQGRGHVFFEDGLVRINDIVALRRFPDFLIPQAISPTGVLDSTVAAAVYEAWWLTTVDAPRIELERGLEDDDETDGAGDGGDSGAGDDGTPDQDGFR